MTEQKHVIIVDDDPDIQDVLGMLLEHSGYIVTVFDNGDSLLTSGFKHPDLLIIDKQLPGVDGLDICRYLKSQETTKHIPVIILSASPQAGILAKAACADSFLEKPFKMKELRNTVEQLLLAKAP